MRKSCLECVRKHTGDALAVMDETYLGYPQHAPLVEGHLDQAASEAVKEFPALAMALRKFRTDWSAAFNLFIMGTDEAAKSFPDVEALLTLLHETRLQVIMEASLNARNTVPVDSEQDRGEGDDGVQKAPVP